MEFIRLFEQSHLSIKRTLDKLGTPKSTFYRWYNRCLSLAEPGLEDRTSRPGRVWNRIPDAVRQQIVKMAPEQPERSPIEWAVPFYNTKRYFVSESSVYRLLKAHGLIANPVFMTKKAANEFQEKAARPNQLWKTDVTSLKVIG